MNFDPYHKWLAIPPQEQPPNHYRLLGLSLFEADLDVIDAAASKQADYLRACSNGPHVDLSQKLLGEVAAARLCLISVKKKAEYDRRLRDQMSTSLDAETFDPYRQWLGIPVEEQPLNHYRLLGVPRYETNREAIRLAAHQRMQQVKGYQRGEHAAASKKIVNEIITAKACLLTPRKKAVYDELLRRRLAQSQGANPDRPNVESSAGAAEGAAAVTETASPWSAEVLVEPLPSRPAGPRYAGPQGVRRRTILQIPPALAGWTLFSFALGAVIAVVYLFWDYLWRLSRRPKRRGPGGKRPSE
jgi:hypothetical protein